MLEPLLFAEYVMRQRASVDIERVGVEARSRPGTRLRVGGEGRLGGNVREAH